MSRKVLFLILSLAFLPLCMTAQDTTDTRAALKAARFAYQKAKLQDRYRPDDKRMSVRFFAAGTSYSVADEFRMRWDMTYMDLKLSEVYSDYFPAIYGSGAYGFEFDYSLSQRVTVSASAGMTSVWGDITEPVHGTVKGRECGTAFAVIPRIKYLYRNTPMVRLYSYVGLGLVGYSGFSRMEGDPVAPCFDFCYLGIEYGRRLFVSAELSTSSISTCKFGIGYRF